MVKLNTKFFLMIIAAINLIACDKTNRSFSLAAGSNTFQQTPEVIVRKIDILWVVDNSGSMASSQANLTANLQSFIERIQELNYDFRMAVTSTDAFRGNFSANPDFKNAARRVRRGILTGGGAVWGYTPDSGVHVMDNNTPDLNNVFITNATQGINGSGDERAFQSIEDVLAYDGNNDFHRPDAYLAVIIVSDEDDFSSAQNYYVPGDYNSEANSDPMVLTAPNPANPLHIYHLYNDPRLLPVSHYKDYLDGYAGAGNYSVSAISIMDNTCKADLNAQSGGRRLGRRYTELADLTKGAKASLCDDFGVSLKLISDTILDLSSVFKLDREPKPESIIILVNGTLVPQGATNGWTYNAATLEITFHGTAVPPQGATVSVSFDPMNPLN